MNIRELCEEASPLPGGALGGTSVPLSVFSHFFSKMGGIVLRVGWKAFFLFRIIDRLFVGVVGCLFLRQWEWSFKNRSS